MQINIQATGMEMTDAINQYVREKMEGLTKFFDNIQQMDIDVGQTSTHHNKGKIYFAEVNVHVPGKIVRVVKESEDLYKAINKVKDHLKVELDEMKEKMRDKDQKGIRAQKGYEV
jgi:ribosomal subunit interface protein